MNIQGVIEVGVLPEEVLVRVDGKGSFGNSRSLRQFTREMVKRGHKNFFIDLSCCSLMDSTFMGTLAGLALKLRETGGGRVCIHGVNERNTDLLRGLGLDHLLEVLPEAPPEVRTATLPPPCATSERTPEVSAETMLEAHEALVKAAPENLTKFKDVLEFLRMDLAAD